MRLIDAEKIGLTDMEIVMCDGSYKKALEMLLNKILNAPTVDVEPIKRRDVGYTGIDDDYLVSIKEVIDITAETGAMETQRRIRELMPIDVVKHGRWIRTTKADYAWECSACGYGLCDNRTTYCYDCGARMDGEEE